MKKTYVLITLGILLFSSGFFMYMKKSNKMSSINGDDVILSRDEAVNIMGQLINNVIKVYENPNEVFDTSETEDTTIIKINNYMEIISSIFSKDGILQLENIVFNEKKFITKNDNGTFVLKANLNKYSNSKINVDQITITKNTISGVFTFYSYDLDSNNDINYYVITKNISAVKVDNKWLIDNFEYNN